MKWTAQDIKTALTTELEKNGSSLDEFEQSLRQRPASLDKVAIDVGAIAKGLFNATGALGIGMGALGGAGIYGAYQMNQNSDDKIMKKLKERQQYMDATQSLQAAMADAQPAIPI